ncbi:MAG: hypothetical protein QOD77_1037 [Thermoplasmata archaeon]|jgi:hypothetical protein|nr:hypothetical protein [Thermoplasmata archaeon]
MHGPYPALLASLVLLAVAAQGQVGLPPETQVGPNCLGESHHVELDSIVVDLNRICVTVILQEPNGDDPPAPDPVPSGMVAAFDLAACPGGWTAFTAAAGRNVIGVGAGAGLSARTLGQTGGEETHTLSVAEMPSHAHGIYTIAEGQWGGAVGRPAMSGGIGGNTDSTGGGSAHNVMDPFVALLYCKKL